MTEISLFSNPFLLGFDYLEQALERIGKSAGESYPPYNIEQTNNDEWQITLAVAGFSKRTLNVTVEDNQLVIRGRQDEDDQNRFLHRGIAARQFLRRFLLAEGIKVERAELDNGLLTILLVRPHLTPLIQEIEIVTGDAPGF